MCAEWPGAHDRRQNHNRLRISESGEKHKLGGSRDRASDSSWLREHQAYNYFQKYEATQHSKHSLAVRNNIKILAHDLSTLSTITDISFGEDIDFVIALTAAALSANQLLMVAGSQTHKASHLA